MNYRIYDSQYYHTITKGKYDAIKEAGIAITDNGDNTLGSCEVELDTIEELYTLMSTVNEKLLMYPNGDILIFDRDIEY